ncbi:MAG: PfaD family polyunsaturated fatty acid/polyketide biosynthesis protein [Candidatus Hydrogenedentes bacterium]|nr:PfaD family polyunsaturated fatty acid/polyketide biosynthesis protein [Candidatus Hydrogenedentota bacterium]
MPFNKKNIAWWDQGGSGDSKQYASLEEALPYFDQPLYVLKDTKTSVYAVGGELRQDAGSEKDTLLPVVAFAPVCSPELLGDRNFSNIHGLKYPCYAGSMAHGIASVELVEAMGKAGMMGFFGSAGLSLDALEEIIKKLHNRMLGKPFGFNLINSPGNTAWERGVVALFLQHGIRLIEASAYILPTPALVKYRVTGLRQDAQGKIFAPNNIIAKVSRSEIAKRFLEPPPARLLKKLLATGEISKEEARLAAFIPLAQDITAEADSGGHTDHRTALAVLPSIQRVRDEIQSKHDYALLPRIGLAGGIGTPQAAAAAFAMGAAYIVTGSINQACVESGTSQRVREMLAQALQTDVARAPAADMFEMGVTVQVLKRGTRFAERASKLYDLFKKYESVDAIPEEERQKIESTIFKSSFDEIWEKTTSFFTKNNPEQLEKAAKNPKHKLALICRWYLGSAVQWATSGEEERKSDFQVWCGPAMGAFNDWTRGSYLEEPANRKVAVVALQMLHSATLLLRIQALRMQGVDIPTDIICKMGQPDFSGSINPENNQ